MHRKKILEVVAERISSIRNTTHGDPLRNLAHATKLKNVLLQGPSYYTLTDVEKEAIAQILTKCSRLVCGNHDQDSWEDIAGYAAIAAQSRSLEKERVEYERLGDAIWGDDNAKTATIKVMMKKKK